MDVLFRQSALLSVDRYDRFRHRLGHEPMGSEILAAIEERLETATTWQEIAAPVYRIRGEALPVKRLLVRVRSKQFKTYVRPGPQPAVATVTHIRHPGQPPIERS
jgi:hypothetical protein